VLATTFKLNWSKRQKKKTATKIERRHRKGQLVWHFSCRHLERTAVRIDSRLQSKFLLLQSIEWGQSNNSLDNERN